MTFLFSFAIIVFDVTRHFFERHVLVANFLCESHKTKKGWGASIVFSFFVFFMNNVLFVGGLAWATTPDTLAAAFAQYGTVVEAFVSYKPDGRSNGFGFVTMSTAEEAAAAVAGLNQTELDGRTITVDHKRDNPRPRFGDGERRPRREFNDRGPRREYGDRPSSRGTRQSEGRQEEYSDRY